eukprot:scaffold45132_cov64-Phaeocystis_antarctica.AAC.2
MAPGEWAVSDAYKPKPGGSQQHQQPQQTKGARMTTVGGGLPSTKKQARSLERLLRRSASSSGGTLPANVVKEKEEAVKQLTEKAAVNKRTERERHFSKKYHKVKFFERLKVEKRIGVLRKQLAEASVAAKKAPLEEQLREAEHDLLYVQHFPRHKKYLSLFPSEENPYVTKERARIRAMLVRRSAEGTLESKPESKAVSKAARKEAREGAGGGEEEDESEGEDEEDTLEEDAFFAGADEADEADEADDDVGDEDDDDVDDDDDDDDVGDDDDDDSDGEDGEGGEPSGKAPAGRPSIEAWKEQKRTSLKAQQKKGVALWEEASSDGEGDAEQEDEVPPAKKSKQARPPAAEAQAAQAIQRAGFKIAPNVAKAKGPPAQKKQERNLGAKGKR